MMNRISRRFIVSVFVVAMMFFVGLCIVQRSDYQSALESRKELTLEMTRRMWEVQLRLIENQCDLFFQRFTTDARVQKGFQSGDGMAIDLAITQHKESVFNPGYQKCLILLLNPEGEVKQRWAESTESLNRIETSEVWKRAKVSGGLASGIEIGNAQEPLLRICRPWDGEAGLVYVWMELPLRWIADEIDLCGEVFCRVRIPASDAASGRVMEGNPLPDFGLHELDHDQVEAALLEPHGIIHMESSGRRFQLAEMQIDTAPGVSDVSLLVLDDITELWRRFLLGCIRSVGVIVFASLLLLLLLPAYFIRYDRKIKIAEDTLALQMEERETAREKLEERERMFRNLFEGSPIPMIQIDYEAQTEAQIGVLYREWRASNPGDSVISFESCKNLQSQLSAGFMDCINTAAMDFFAVSGKIQTVSNIRWLVDTTDDLFKTALVRLIAKHQSFSNVECEITPNHGARHNVVVDFAVIESKEEQESIIVTFRDVTDQRREHEAALLAKEEAEEANRLKSCFLSNMTHELKTPLNAIIGFSDLLADTTVDASSLEQLKLIQDSGRHLLNIIKDILELTRIDTDRSNPNFSLFGLQEFVSEFLHPYQSIAKTKGLRLEHVTAKMPSAYVYGDQVKLHHILTNVINNALKFTHEGGIEVGASIDILGPGAMQRAMDLSPGLREEIQRIITMEFDDAANASLCRLHFSVADTGTGIEDDVIQKIFDPFYQGDNSSTRRYGGTGLGLTVCRKLVLLMDGKISCENRKEGGARVEFTVYGLTSLSGEI